MEKYVLLTSLTPLNYNLRVKCTFTPATMQTYAIITKSHLDREGPGGIILGFLFYGCTLEAEGAASENVGVREGATTPLTRRKGLGAGFLFQLECAAVLEVEGGAPEGGGAKLIVGCAGTDGIEAEGGEGTYRDCGCWSW